MNTNLVRAWSDQLARAVARLHRLQEDMRRYGANTVRQALFDDFRADLYDVIGSMKGAIDHQTADDFQETFGEDFGMKRPLIQIVDDEPDNGGTL
jgi:hypothetical protein